MVEGLQNAWKSLGFDDFQMVWWLWVLWGISYVPLLVPETGLLGVFVPGFCPTFGHLL